MLPFSFSRVKRLTWLNSKLLSLIALKRLNLGIAVINSYTITTFIVRTNVWRLIHLLFLQCNLSSKFFRKRDVMLWLAIRSAWAVLQIKVSGSHPWQRRKNKIKMWHLFWVLFFILFALIESMSHYLCLAITSVFVWDWKHKPRQALHWYRRRIRIEESISEKACSSL